MTDIITRESISKHQMKRHRCEKINTIEIFEYIREYDIEFNLLAIYFHVDISNLSGHLVAD